MSEDTEDRVEDSDYYNSAPVTHLAPNSKEFVEKALTRSIPRAKRQKLAKEYPRPNTPAAKVPKLDMVFRSALGKGTSDRSDEQLAKIQGAVLAAGNPITNLLSHFEGQGIKGYTDEVVPSGDVVRVMKDTLALLGNASCYISQVRRSQFINSINPQRPSVARFLREVTKELPNSDGSELFGPEVQKMVTSRADTIDALNKAASKVESTNRLHRSSQEPYWVERKVYL